MIDNSWKKLHQNAFWLFFLRSIFSGGARNRYSRQFANPLLFIIIIFTILSFFLYNSILSRLINPATEANIPQLSSLPHINLKFINSPLILLLFLSLYLIFSFFKAQFYFNSYEYKINDFSIEVKRGIFSIRESEIPINKIQNVDIIRNPLHRMLGLGCINIQTAGYSKPDNNDLNSNDDIASEAVIDGIKKEEAESIKQFILDKIKK